MPISGPVVHQQLMDAYASVQERFESERGRTSDARRQRDQLDESRDDALVSLAERQREVATFLALGYTQWQVGAMFVRESMLVNVTGTLLGLPMGYGLTVLTVIAYAEGPWPSPVECD